MQCSGLAGGRRERSREQGGEDGDGQEECAQGQTCGGAHGEVGNCDANCQPLLATLFTHFSCPSAGARCAGCAHVVLAVSLGTVLYEDGQVVLLVIYAFPPLNACVARLKSRQAVQTAIN